MPSFETAGRVIPGEIVRADKPWYPPRATREALANASCHRDYVIPGGAVAFALYDDRPEITNPGAFHFGITPEILSKPHESRQKGKMKIYRTIRAAMKALARNPMRAMLTALGIVIGVGSVIAMMEIGAGSSSAIRDSIVSIGANLLNVFPGATSSAGVSSGTGSAVSLTSEDAAAIFRECPSIRSVSPLVRTRTQVVFGNRNWVPTFIDGVTPAYLDVREYTMAEGEPFSDRDVLTANTVCLVGQTLVHELFQGESPIGKEIRIKNVSFRVVGVLGSKGVNTWGTDQDDVILAPWTSIKYRVTGSPFGNANQSASIASDNSVNTLSNLYPGSEPSPYPNRSVVQAADYPMQVRFANIHRIMAAAQSPEKIPSAINEMTSVLRERHHLLLGEPDDFRIRDMTEMAKALTTTTTLMTNLLLCVAMISLVVGGVGIMNIMLVSVTERTREIGLRMAVGARSRDILEQFLIEAVLLCVSGGGVGILVGHGGSYLVWLLLQWPVEISPVAIALAVLVSASVGIVFGYYPAWKASRLDPIEALRYE